MKVLTSIEAEKFLSKYVPIAKSKFITKLEQIPNKFPVVLKIISPKALHKSDKGAVLISQNKEELKRYYNKLTELAKKLKPAKILAQEYIQGQQIIIGIKKDPTFNHVIMLGIGGTLVELIKDVQFRMCPINENEAQDMIDQLKLNKLLKGYRDYKAININLLKQILVKLSKMPMKNISELDINPLIINNKEAKIVDARIVLN